jgi:hypothetical protein
MEGWLWIGVIMYREDCTLILEFRNLFGTYRITLHPYVFCTLA